MVCGVWLEVCGFRFEDGLRIVVMVSVFRFTPRLKSETTNHKPRTTPPGPNRKTPTTDHKPQATIHIWCVTTEKDQLCMNVGSLWWLWAFSKSNVHLDRHSTASTRITSEQVCDYSNCVIHTINITLTETSHTKNGTPLIHLGFAEYEISTQWLQTR